MRLVSVDGIHARLLKSEIAQGWVIVGTATQRPVTRDDLVVDGDYVGEEVRQSQCPLLGVKRTLIGSAPMSALGQKRTLAVRICRDAQCSPSAW